MHDSRLTSLPCPNCGAPIDIANAEWCHCVTKPLTVICPTCMRCFCKTRDSSRCDEWKLALMQRHEGQIAEEFRRSIQDAQPGAGRPTVLIVDDDDEIRLIADYTIREMGYRTFTAGDAKEAMEIFDRVHPGIVLTDALMPKLDGRQLCRLIKEVVPATKVIVMSAVYRAARYRSEAFRTFRADAYLPKPIDFRELRSLLDHLAVEAA